MEPLTPNTSAFLSYLSSGIDTSAISTDQYLSSKDNMNPSSLPPSAFFPMPVPGRDTPEITPPSSNEADQNSPVKHSTFDSGLPSDDSEEDSGRNRKSGGSRRKSEVNHKRKAGSGTQRNNHDDDEDDDEEDSASDSANGHDDKRQHPSNTKANATASGSGRKGGRKSVGEDGATSKGSSKDKAARRKEQNRAAQKAFRERREAKVSLLEEKVAELEHKSFGVSVENENLRGILKRLQEENVALKQSAFTFSMPVGSSPQNGQKPSGNGTDTPTGRAAGQNGPMAQIGKPPTPSHTMSDDSLKSINEVSSFSNQPARQKSNQSSPTYDSPDSLVSIGSGNGFSSETSNGNQVNLFGNSPMDFGNMSSNSRPSLTSLPSSGSSNPVETPKSTTSTNNGTEIDALWASFMQQNRPQQSLPAQTQPAWNTNTPNMLGAAQPLAFADDNTKVCDKPVNTWDKSAFRDVTAPAADVSAPQAQQFEARAAPAQADPWSNVMDSSVNEFLASLTGANGEVNDNFGTADDDFNAQLQQILGVDASPSAPFSLPGNPFSPTNYLNMSPSPNASGSNGTSPQSVVSQSASNYASPDSTSTGPTSASGSVASGSSVGQKYTPGLATFGPPKSDAEHVHIVDEAGNIIPPSEVWMRSGMKDHPGMLDHLLLDDLCDQMRAKATCKDGKMHLSAAEAEELFRYKQSPVHRY